MLCSQRPEKVFQYSRSHALGINKTTVERVHLIEKAFQRLMFDTTSFESVS